MPLQNTLNNNDESQFDMIRLSGDAQHEVAEHPVTNQDMGASSDPNNRKRRHTNGENERRERVKRYFEAALLQLGIVPNVIERYVHTGQKTPFTLEMREALRQLIAGRSSELKEDTQDLSAALELPLLIENQEVFYPSNNKTILTVKGALSAFLKIKDAVARASQNRRAKKRRKTIQPAEASSNPSFSATGSPEDLLAALPAPMGHIEMESEELQASANEEQINRKSKRSSVNVVKKIRGRSEPEKRRHAALEKERRERVKRYFEAALLQLGIVPNVFERYVNPDKVTPFTLEMREALRQLIAGRSSALKEDTQGLSAALEQPLLIENQEVFYPSNSEIALTVKGALSVFLKIKDTWVREWQKKRAKHQKQNQVFQPAEVDFFAGSSSIPLVLTPSLMENNSLVLPVDEEEPMGLQTEPDVDNLNSFLMTGTVFNQSEEALSNPSFSATGSPEDLLAALPAPMEHIEMESEELQSTNEERIRRKRKHPDVSAGGRMSLSSDASSKRRRHADVENKRRERVKRYFEAALLQLGIVPNVIERYVHTGQKTPFTLEMREALRQLIAGRSSELKEDTQDLSAALELPLLIENQEVFYPSNNKTILTVKGALSTFLKDKDERALRTKAAAIKGRQKGQIKSTSQVSQSVEVFSNPASFATSSSTGFVLTQLGMGGGSSQSFLPAGNELSIAAGSAVPTPERTFDPTLEVAPSVLHGGASGERDGNRSFLSPLLPRDGYGFRLFDEPSLPGEVFSYNQNRSGVESLGSPEDSEAFHSEICRVFRE